MLRAYTTLEVNPHGRLETKEILGVNRAPAFPVEVAPEVIRDSSALSTRLCIHGTLRMRCYT